MAEARRGLLGRLFGGEAADRRIWKTVPEVEKTQPAERQLPRPLSSRRPPLRPPRSRRSRRPAGGWWQRLKSGLSRSTQSLTTGIADVFTKRKLDARKP